MIELRNKYWAVEAPEGATGFDVNQYGGGSELNYWVVEEGKQNLIVKDLPPGTYQIICTLKDATYTQAEQIVERDGDGFKDYNEDNFHHDLPFMSPFESLRSLLTVRGCDVSKNWLIIKKG